MQVNIPTNKIEFTSINEIYFFFNRNKLYGKALYFAVLAVFGSYLGFILIKYEYVPTFDVIFGTADEVYYSTLARGMTYFIACGAAYLFTTNKIHLSQVRIF